MEGRDKNKRRPFWQRDGFGARRTVRRRAHE